MKIKETLQTMLLYYTRARGVGHTYVLKNGVDRVKNQCIVVGTTIKQSEDIVKKTEIVNMGLSSLNSGIQGLRIPIAFDNFALMEIFGESLGEINRLEDELRTANIKLNHIKSIINE